MQNKWDSSEATHFIGELTAAAGNDLASCIYASRLVGSEADLVLHGGGNTSVKSTTPGLWGDPQYTLFVKASGFDLARITPQGFPPLDLNGLLRLQSLAELSQEEMARQLKLRLLDPAAPMPSVEAFLHAFIPSRFIIHSHPSSILGLTNQVNGSAVLQHVFKESVTHVPYIRAGFGLAKAAAAAFHQKPDADAMILLKHGLVTWGETAEEAYAATIRIVSKAEEYWAQKIQRSAGSSHVDLSEAWARYTQLAPIIRGVLAEPTSDPDHPFDRFILSPLITEDVLELLDHSSELELLTSEPLTPDHLIRTKAKPLWIQDLQYKDLHRAKVQIQEAVEAYVRDYDAYFERHSFRLAKGATRLDARPRVLMIPGIGIICAGIHERAAKIACDITEQSIRVKGWFVAGGIQYEGIGEEHLFEMEYLLMQQAKVKAEEPSLRRQVAVVTGAAGAIGIGITEALLRNGCHVAVTDLPGESLQKVADDLSSRYPNQVLAVPMDVTDVKSVEASFSEVIKKWGGIDLLVINAGIALVSSLDEMDIERFRALERVNVEGALIGFREIAKIFRSQGTGGDVILISTKNVFAPGAKFGAYSATKAAAHQLARIASLEMAELDVRVNMVAPDAVFSHGQTRSGLWTEVGPDRMKARGLDEAGLENYYKNRNLLKATITAEHVGRAVLFFATRQTPTTGATLPVDGGLPDSTPR